MQTFTPPEKKDNKYWEKRGKNNIAARRFYLFFEIIYKYKYKLVQILDRREVRMIFPPEGFICF